MPFARVDALCFQAEITPREICVRFPVGNEVCVSLPQVNNADPSELLQALFAMVNSALTPLNPLFDIIDAVIAVFDCVKAIPKAIIELNPTPLIECIPNLAAAIEKLLQLIPQLSLPFMIVDTIDVIILFLNEIKRTILRMQAQAAAILAANLRAAAPGNVALALTMDCINANFDADLINLNAQMAPLNRLLGIIDFILELTGLKALLSKIGLDVMPCIGNIDLVGGTAAIDYLIQLLELLRSIIPLPGSFDFDVSGTFDNSDC